jgi:hypothetical protein
MAGGEGNPQYDRHFAQRNLRPFGVVLGGGHGITWANAVISQVGAGMNVLTLESSLPGDAFTTYLAIPTQTFEAHVGRDGLHGWEILGKGGQQPLRKPFPDCVLLRQTGKPDGNGVQLRLADHRRQPFLGLSLGVEWNGEALRRHRVLGDVSLAHRGSDGLLAGGFTLQPVVQHGERELSR